MVIILTCSCGKRLQIDDDHAGARGLCPVCSSFLTIPESTDKALSPDLEPGEIALPVLLAAPEPSPPESNAVQSMEPPVDLPVPLAAPEPSPPESDAVQSMEPPVELPQPREPELAPSPTPAPSISLELATDAPPLPVAGPLPAPPTPETVVVPLLPLSALISGEVEALDFVDRQAGTRPRYGVFPLRAAFLAALLGGCLGGAIVLAYNYQSLRRRWAMRLTGAAGILSLLIFLVAICVWPQIHEMAWLRLALFAMMAPLWVILSPSFALAEKAASFVPALVMLGAAWFLQRDLYYDHLRRGGRPTSVWHAITMSLFCAVFAFTGIGLHHALFPETRQAQAKVQVFNPGGLRQINVYYQAGVDETDLRRVGTFLVIRGPSGVNTVHLTPRGDGYIVSFVVREVYWDDPVLCQTIRALVPELSEKLDGAPIRVEFCNEELTRRRPIR